MPCKWEGQQLRISEKLMTRYKNMNLTRKMLLVYFIFAGFFLVVTVLTFQITMEAFEERLYSNSLQELDYYVQSVRESLEGVEERSREMAINTNIQEMTSELTEIGPGTVQYSQILTDMRWELIYENTEGTEINGVRYIDTYGNSVESAGCPWNIADDEMEKFLETVQESSGEAVFYGPTRDCGYLLCGRKVLKWSDASLDNLGTLIFFCDVGKIIANNKEQMQAVNSALFVYTDENMIYQDIEEELPALPEGGPGPGYSILKYQSQRYFMCWLTAPDTGWTYVNFFPYSDIYGQVTSVRNITLIGFGVAFIVLLFLIRKLAGIITKPLETLAQSMQVVETGDFQSAKLIPMDADRKDEVGVLTQEFKVMLDKIDVLIYENYEKQLLLKDTKYKMLQAQINPHFLYNTLNAIHWMIRAKKNDDAGRMIVELGILLRASFDENPYTTVEQEISMLKSYIAIQRLRYEDRAEFSVRTEGEPGQYVMPRMTLQPLVENAIFYGADVMTEICYIDIAVTEEEQSILFEVKDNGPGIEKEELEKVRNFTVKPKGHGIGIKNIYERLRITYDEFDFAVDSEPGKGTVIRIRVPKQKSEG